MLDAHRPPLRSADVRPALEGLARGLRFRLEGDARAGLAAVSRAPTSAAGPGLPRAGDAPGGGAPGGAAPVARETRTAEDLKQALEARVAEAQAPVVHVAGPGLFDAGPPPGEDGLSREDALARVAAEVAACDRCAELAACRTRTVPGQGSPHARLVFIGEGPGQDEDAQGLAFVGRAGQLLTKMIEAVDLNREEVFICNILKCRPPGNRQPTPEEAANCAPYLARQLAILRPKVIVALGGTAAQNLLQTHDGITRLRGRIYPYLGAKLIPTFHPAYVLRNYTLDTRSKVYDDLKKARAEMDV